MYVANRVQEIQDCTDKKQCRYMESKQNPADGASRGMRAKELDPEVKKSVTMTTSPSEKGKSTLDERVERFSSWYRAQRAVA